MAKLIMSQCLLARHIYRFSFGEAPNLPTFFSPTQNPIVKLMHQLKQKLKGGVEGKVPLETPRSNKQYNN